MPHRLALLALTALLVAPAARAQLTGPYTIGGADPDYTTFGAAVSALTSQGVAGPVTFRVRAGTYSEAGGQAAVLDVGPIPGVSAASRVTFEPDAATGAGVDDVVLERSGGSTTGTQGYLARLDSDFVTLRELTLRDADSTSSGFTSTHFVSIQASGEERRGVEIVGCVLASGGRARIVVGIGGAFKRFYDLRIAGNRFHDFVAGVVLAANNSNRFLDPRIEGNQFTGMRYAAGSGGGTPPSVPIQVSGANERLVIRRNVLDYASAAGNSGIDLSGRALDFTLDANEIRNVFSGGLYGGFQGISVSDPLSRGRIVNNMVSVNTPRRTGMYVGASGGVLIAHNTIYLPERSIDHFGGSRALSTCGSNLRVLGNVLVERGLAATSLAAIVKSCDGADNRFDGNLLYSSGALVVDEGFPVPSLDVWRARGHGASSVSKLPEIADVHADLRLAGCSGPDPELRTVPIDDPATATDVDGDARTPLAAAMGADQPPAETLVQPFGPAVALAVGTGPDADRPLDVAAGDFDGDGDLDLAVAVTNDFDSWGAVEVLENLGGGHFGPAQALPSLTIGPRILVRAGDLDDDGAIDLVAAARSPGTPLRLSVYWGVGDGSFTPGEPVRVPGILTPTAAYTAAIWDLELGDLDGDGDLEIAVIQESDPPAPSGLTVLCHEEPRLFTDIPLTGSSFRFDLALGDVDGDGDVDAVTDEDVWENLSGCALAGKGALDAPALDTTALYPALAIADLDGDGAGDLVADLPDGGLYEGSLLLLRADGDGGFEPAEPLPVEPAFERRPGPLAALDYDGDGAPDVLVGNRFPSGPTNLVPGTGVLLRNDGGGDFARALACGGSELPAQPRKLVAADLDGDGLDDVVAPTWNDGEAIWWLRNASAGFAPVAIEDFAAALGAGSVALSWATPAEENNAGFEVERRLGGAGPWQRIGLVPGAGTTSEPHEYALADEDPPASGEVRYRLRQVDVSGSVRAGPELAIQVPEPAGAALAAAATLAALRRVTRRWRGAC